MSWDGFKKAINRAGQSVHVKNIDKTVDKNYDIEERRYRSLEKCGEAICLEARGYHDSLKQVAQSQLKIAEVISSLYDDTNNGATGSFNVGKSYFDTVTEFDEEIIKQLDVPFMETVITPLEKFSYYFKEIDDAITKRDHKKQDYDAAKSKVRRLTEKPTKDSGKLPRAEKELESAKDAYEQLNEQLKSELPQLLSLRVPYYDPTFESMIKIQMRFSTEGYTKLAQVQQYLDQQARDDYANGLLDAKLDEILQKMMQLDICTLGYK
ncbi:hypothetical protein TPHA_0O01020 [Tetrapisispora phaffii CBS 4417]|uniref:BAR domain-containing protein n=1 Tax=Tetrapisispora phaffii (strain ATCC 24235 / CBS 4417 / NBRC 1672 / NRRL Y-8282 / UCD 70-5) TaxID=1071381 RepID=G8C1P3_TETPH|nr:hypothetical protein TPHA_0O01020 [Tetrapisispora phaffii CBS 4417]CCE66071.1 hypothetical protein TPHA_0O01020 [Tetrapisispora phaffii CBS 4417]